MIYNISHRTHYTYNKPVHLEPHTIRLLPRGGAEQNIISSSVQFDPVPRLQTTNLDAEGNTIVEAYWDDTHETMGIATQIRVETFRRNPFDFLLDNQQCSFPPDYGPSADMLHAYTPPCTADKASLEAFCEDLPDKAKNNIFEYALAVNAKINTELEYWVRPQGHPNTAEETLKLGGGSCRDLSVLFMELCHLRGIPARFVSGYHEGDPDIAENHLHAWAEIYVPRGGWRAFDPTLGLMVADMHVPVAAALLPIDAAPVSGTFRGTDAQAEMKAAIQIDRVEGQTQTQTQSQTGMSHGQSER